MSTIRSNVDAVGIERSLQFESDTICCYLDAEVSRLTARFVLSGECLLATQALRLLMRLDRKLREARADWNQDRFRRVMRARSKAVSRVRRRWSKLDPAPAIALGKLRRRYHANLAGYLYRRVLTSDPPGPNCNICSVTLGGSGRPPCCAGACKPSGLGGLNTCKQ